MTTFKTFLMEENSGEYSKLVDIKEFPDLFGAPEMLDKTTMSDSGRRYEPGINENEALTYTANYDLETFTTLKAKEGQKLKLAHWFGGTESNGVVTPTGEEGKFEFEGYLTVTINGAGVNEIVEMTITIALDSEITVAD